MGPPLSCLDNSLPLKQQFQILKKKNYSFDITHLPSRFQSCRCFDELLITSKVLITVTLLQIYCMSILHSLRLWNELSLLSGQRSSSDVRMSFSLDEC